MGIAQQLQEPTAVVCTSGSALLNYYPAVAEAFYSNTPLIVLSADRPKHLIGIGDGQTINQKDIFKNHILLFSLGTGVGGFLRLRLCWWLEVTHEGVCCLPKQSEVV